MRPFRILIGVVLIAVGSIAAVSGEFGDSYLWIIAAAIGAAGLLGIASALRRPPEPSD